MCNCRCHLGYSPCKFSICLCASVCRVPDAVGSFIRSAVPIRAVIFACAEILQGPPFGEQCVVEDAANDAARFTGDHHWSLQTHISINVSIICGHEDQNILIHGRQVDRKIQEWSQRFLGLFGGVSGRRINVHVFGDVPVGSNETIRVLLFDFEYSGLLPLEIQHSLLFLCSRP
ncbi:hypothetical protein BJX70DRAFT_359893 [Aspergillus crustosus]